jgi:predicted chitinase
MNLSHIALAAIPVLLSTSIQAATPEAWAAHDKTLLAKCLQASQLKNPHAAGSPALFDDSIGYSALLLKGTYPQKFMNNRSGTELCLYQRTTQKAVITEWDRAIAAPTAKRP